MHGRECNPSWWTKQLASKDAEWLPPDNESHYVTSIDGKEKALALGVQPTKWKFLDKYTTSAANCIGVPFGQQEKTYSEN